VANSHEEAVLYNDALRSISRHVPKSDEKPLSKFARPIVRPAVKRQELAGGHGVFALFDRKRRSKPAN